RSPSPAAISTTDSGGPAGCRAAHSTASRSAGERQAACRYPAFSGAGGGTAERLEGVDQAVGGGIVIDGRGVRFQLLQDDGCKLLAQLDTPLIERVDPPDHALHEDLVLVEGDQGAEAARIEPPQQDRIGRLIAGE